MKHIKTHHFLLVLFSVITFSCAKKNATKTPVTKETESTETTTKLSKEDSLKLVIKNIEKSPEIVWLSVEQAEELQEVKPKKILLDLYTTWCGYCKIMDKKTYKNNSIVKEVNQHFYAIKFDAQSSQSVTYNQKTYTKQGSYHGYAIQYLGKRASFPSTIFIGEEKEFLTNVPGYWKPDQFKIILDYFSGNHFKKMSFDEYKRTQN